MIQLYIQISDEPTSETSIDASRLNYCKTLNLDGLNKLFLNTKLKFSFPIDNFYEAFLNINLFFTNNEQTVLEQLKYFTMVSI